MDALTVFEFLYYCIAVGTLGAWIAALMKKHQTVLWLGWAVLVANFAACLAIGFTAGRIPIYGHFEVIIQICFILSLVAVWDAWTRRSKENLPGINTGIWTVSFLLLVLLSIYPKSLNADFYMYDRLSVLSFFNFRICAAAFFLVGAICICTASFSSTTVKSPAGSLPWRGRRFLLIGSICFLVSEFTGSYWCLNWYGDSWHWSRNFLEAACVFMGIMLAFHIPAGWRVPRTIRAVLGCLPAMGVLWLLLI
jgi:hypothetical protein